jgi:hypothetical protein
MTARGKQAGNRGIIEGQQEPTGRQQDKSKRTARGQQDDRKAGGQKEDRRKAWEKQENRRTVRAGPTGKTGKKTRRASSQQKRKTKKA